MNVRTLHGVFHHSIMPVDCVSMDLHPDSPIEAFLAVTEGTMTLRVLSLIVWAYTESDMYIHCVIVSRALWMNAHEHP